MRQNILSRSFKPGSNRGVTNTASSPSETSATHVFWGSKKNAKRGERMGGGQSHPTKTRQNETKIY